MKKLVLALVLLVVVTGAALAIVKWLGFGPFGGTEGDPPPAATAPPSSAYYVALDAILVPLLRDDKVAGTVQIQVKLEVVGDQARDAVLQAKPRLSDAYFQELYAYIPRLLAGGARLDVGMLKKRLQLVSDKTVGGGIVQDVLLQSVTELPAS